MNTNPITWRCHECGVARTGTEQERFAALRDGEWESLDAQDPAGRLSTVFMHARCRRAWSARQLIPISTVLL